MTATAISPVTLNEQIREGILSRLTDDLVAWTDIRRHLPGGLQSQGEALIDLFERGKVYCIKIAGRNYVKKPFCLGTEGPSPHIRCREFRVL
ncbi:hypothetical protein [Mycobacteroides abscessus]|uniref:hypothetical protein n=1 Tax=Mycobacteroides abscessus TaxID=36809 RepID=UPI00092AB8F7|nr:hypothetical protein [Mycobacteroides abscessus]SIL05627.1 Uncharacterised protein [Mycobacteroides abscessus subsp. abscessus]